MAGELHSPPDDGARARADDVESEQARADALADRIAAYAPAGSDLRATARAVERDPYELLVPVAPEIAARLGADWSEPVQFRLVERGDGHELILRTVAEASRLDPECSLCAVGHVPARPCADEPAIFRASGTVDFDWGPNNEPGLYDKPPGYWAGRCCEPFGAGRCYLAQGHPGLHAVEGPT